MTNSNNNIIYRELLEPPPTTSKPMLFAVLNSQSIRNTTLPVKDLTVESDIDVLAFTENWLSDESDDSPDYLNELLKFSRPGRNLRLANKLLLKIQSYQLKMYGYRVFFICALSLWNSLPLELRLLEYVEDFKRPLKLSYLKEHIII